MRLVEVMLKALAPGLPDRIPAGTKGMICHVGFGGNDPRRNEYYCFLETVAGGYGGRASSDGPDAIQPHGQNTENAPIEETEINYPVRIVRYELVEDSEGGGRYRGGLGCDGTTCFQTTRPLLRFWRIGTAGDRRACSEGFQGEKRPTFWNLRVRRLSWVPK